MYSAISGIIILAGNILGLIVVLWPGFILMGRDRDGNFLRQVPVDVKAIHAGMLRIQFVSYIFPVLFQGMFQVLVSMVQLIRMSSLMTMPTSSGIPTHLMLSPIDPVIITCTIILGAYLYAQAGIYASISFQNFWNAVIAMFGIFIMLGILGAVISGVLTLILMGNNVPFLSMIGLSQGTMCLIMILGLVIMNSMTKRAIRLRSLPAA
jgi:hypothetical protein